MKDAILAGCSEIQRMTEQYPSMERGVGHEIPSLPAELLPILNFWENKVQLSLNMQLLISCQALLEGYIWKATNIRIFG